MNKTVKILAILLAAQLLLAVGIGLGNRGVSSSNEPVALVSFDSGKIDRITLEGPDDANVTLEKKGGAWVLPDMADFPVNSEKVKQLFERLGALRSGTPVATSGSARKRFKVSDEQFERRITLSASDNAVARLYLGSSPGMRLIHARNETSDAIHAVKMAVYDVPVKPSDWEDKSVLTFPNTDITAIEVNGLRFERSDPASDGDSKANDAGAPPAWRTKGLAGGKRLNQEAADKLVGSLADLRFDRVLGQEAKDEYGMENPVLEVLVSLKEGDPLTYRLGKDKEKEEYTLKVSNRPEYFRLASYKAKPLVESANREKLTEMSAEAGEEESVSDTDEKVTAPDAGAEGTVADKTARP
ncbi:MAG: DUF4340 domain-containing protein [Candidatus Sedimenticola endophacoides]